VFLGPSRWPPQIVIRYIGFVAAISTYAENVPDELKPLFEVCFILGFGICSSCGREEPFQSSFLKFTDDYWLDEARAMFADGGCVPKQQQALCPQCIAQLKAAT
jgi:hypothetical protein